MTEREIDLDQMRLNPHWRILVSSSRNYEYPKVGHNHAPKIANEG